MDSDDKISALIGSCVIYCCLGVIILTAAVLLGIRSSLESQWELLLLRDMINYIIGPLTFLSLIIAPVIGASVIVYQTKEITIGIRSIKYFFIPILILNAFILLPALVDYLFYPDPNSFDRFAQGLGVGMFSILLIAVLISRLISIVLLTMILRTNGVKSKVGI